MPDLEPVSSMSLQSAYLCESCQRIGNRGTACVDCGGTANLMSLSSVLNRSDNQESEKYQCLHAVMV